MGVYIGYQAGADINKHEIRGNSSVENRPSAITNEKEQWALALTYDQLHGLSVIGAESLGKRSI